MRKTAYILLGVAVAFAAIAILIFSPSQPTSAQDSDVFLPMVSSSGVQGATMRLPPTPDYEVHPEDRHWLTATLPYSETPYEGAPILRPANDVPPMSRADQQRLYNELRANEMRTVVAGLETAGSDVIIAGKAIKLPADVYVDMVVSHVSMDPSDTRPQPDVPLYVLRQIGTEDRQWSTIVIDANGEAVTYADADQVGGIRQHYASVLSSLGVELVAKDPDTMEVR